MRLGYVHSTAMNFCSSSLSTDNTVYIIGISVVHPLNLLPNSSTETGHVHRDSYTKEIEPPCLHQDLCNHYKHCVAGEKRPVNEAQIPGSFHWFRGRPFNFDGGGAWVFFSGQNIFAFIVKAKLFLFQPYQEPFSSRRVRLFLSSEVRVRKFI